MICLTRMTSFIVIIIIMGILGAAPAPVCASEWNRTATIMEASYAALSTIDCGQTIALSKQGVVETNLVLGDHPSKSNIIFYFAGTTLAHSIISYALPKDYRVVWQALTLGVEITATSMNYRSGIRLSF